ncbi:Metal-dependent hydrolase, beta-lactamase superfamily II [Blastococcus aggregatus]|uniref:Metal-dependent hydrolase, beta-lactamase superfamily II n=1 Tax=Blastococcus aggregatus TaxID=38502 RepID=A0A285VCN6_9ACTN|nr:hypothetical protein [Blastococcus aggregatus]SOC50261.1 Metal-dependent hydrolase, beta-lactamase superfamily II [Blastococcus aggregatus]
MLRLEMLPAAHGDALLVTWGTDGDPHRMLVDAGPLGTYRTVHDRIAALGDPPELDLLVVTHVDGDHIEGVIRLLQDRAALGLRIGEVWFNGWPQLPQRDLLGADYGEMVGALLHRDGIPWNTSFDGGPVQVPAAPAPLPRVELPGGASVTVLGPGEPELLRLRSTWTKVLTDAGVTPGRADEALERLDRRTDLDGVDVLGGRAKPDNSVANLSSISLLVEHDGRSLLLTGDSHSAPLVSGITRLLAERGQARLPVGAFKLPHHGSRGNLTDELLALVETERYLVSTNGARYEHPDRPALLQVLDHPQRPRSLELVFNYAAPTTARWLKRSTAQRYGYTPVPPAPDGTGALVEV